MSSIDQQFVEFVVKSLVSNPDAVSIVRSVDEKGVLIELTVDPEDLGRIIGKRGATAQSLRTLLRALGTKNEARYNLKIVDNGPEDARRPRSDRTESVSASSDSAESADNAPVDDDDESPEPVVTSPDVDNEEVVSSSDVVSKTRKELEDLDDLDI